MNDLQSRWFAIITKSQRIQISKWLNEWTTKWMNEWKIKWPVTYCNDLIVDLDSSVQSGSATIGYATHENPRQSLCKRRLKPLCPTQKAKMKRRSEVSYTPFLSLTFPFEWSSRSACWSTSRFMGQRLGICMTIVRRRIRPLRGYDFDQRINAIFL